MTQLWIEPEDLDDPAAPQALDAAQAASMVLYMLSGQKYAGITTTTELYVCEDHSDQKIAVPPWVPVSNLTQMHWSTVAGRLPPTQFRLRGRPVRSISSITTSASAVFDPSEYELMNSGIIRSVENTWASLGACGGGLLVTYTYGSQVPALGRSAARLLANELLKATIDPSQCALPDRVTTVSREGLSYTLLDPQDFLEKGRTGLYLVDLFLQSINPGKAKKPARVFSPDTPTAYRRNPS